jgi:glycosyltransferase involved in cell wall biosynthesis
MPIQVLYLHEFGRIGGAERALLGLADAIRQMAVEPLVVWPRKDGAFTWLESRGVRAAALKVPPWKHGLSLPLLPLFLARLRRTLPPTRLDLMHVNNYRSAPFGHLVSRWVGVPCVCHVRELITPDRIRQYRLHVPEALIAVSDAVAHALAEGGLPRDRIMVVLSGVALGTAPGERESALLRKRLGLTGGDLLIGIVAHILPHKGYDDLVNALALIKEKLPNVRCLIVGGAPRKRYLSWVLHLAERLSVRDRLILVGPQEDVAPFLCAMDLFVLPSHTEGLPITLLEAMASGRPVVATAVGGIAEVVRDGETGLLVPPRDPGQLAEAVIRLLEAPALARAMGEAGRSLVKSAFTLEREARQTSLVYGQVLAANSPDSSGVPKPAGR